MLERQNLRLMVLTVLAAATLALFFATLGSMKTPPQAFRPIETAAEERCLALAVYFEARGEPYEGQVAVAQVVLNRAHDRRYPGHICDVVMQGQERRHRCQFSFACDGKSDRPRDAGAWTRAVTLAKLAITGQLRDLTGKATHYHADYVMPSWGHTLSKTKKIGRHLFYAS